MVAIYRYLHGLKTDDKILYTAPEICNKIIKLSLFYAKKSLNDYHLSESADYQVKWYGLIIFEQALQFYRSMFGS